MRCGFPWHSVTDLGKASPRHVKWWSGPLTRLGGAAEVTTSRLGGRRGQQEYVSLGPNCALLCLNCLSRHYPVIIRPHLGLQTWNFELKK